MEHNLSNRDELLGCIIGLSRVCSMHQKSDRTDLLILQGLIDSSDMNLSDGTIQNTTFLIKSEQSKILCLSYNPKNQKSPQCAKPVPHVGARLGYKPIIFGIERIPI